MIEEEFCSTNNVIQFIQQRKQIGKKNYEIINELIKRNCSFQIIFDAMDKITKKR
jgi:GTP-binding protein EngB required for normal cell division